MRKLAEFIVDKRKFLLIIFIAAAIGSVIMSSHINVIQELTDYLPDDTETSIGLDVMDEQFTTFGTAKVMVQNVTYDQAKAIADQDQKCCENTFFRHGIFLQCSLCFSHVTFSCSAISCHSFRHIQDLQ